MDNDKEKIAGKRTEASQSREEGLERRLERVKVLESEIKARESAVNGCESAKKQVPLRLSAALWEKLAAWAEDEFRSVNGQIEFLLTEAVRQRKGEIGRASCRERV